MSDANILDQTISRWQRWALIVAAAGLGICLLAAVLNLEHFLRAYLFGYLFWWAMTVGCLGLWMLTYLVGGHWSAAARPFLESASLLAPLTAMLFLPLGLGLDTLYSWTDVSTITAEKALYLNPSFFFGRAIAYFLAWSGFAWLLSSPSNPEARWRRMASAGGLVLVILTASFAAFDWGMSLDPFWFSSIYGAIYVVGGALSGFAFVTFLLSVLNVRLGTESRLTSPNTLADLGTLTLAFLMIWAYFSFSQFLIIWAGNLPEENFWYIQRMNGGWQWVGLALVVFQFFLPFFLLLSQERKRTPVALARVCALVFGMQLIAMFWTISPSFYPEGFQIHWPDLLVPVAIGGVWVSGFLWLLGRRLPQVSTREIS